MSFLRFLRAFSFSFISFLPCVASLPPEAGTPSLHPRQDPAYNCRPDYGIPSAGSCRAAIDSIPVYPLHQDTNFGGLNSDVLNPFYRLPKTYTSGNCEIKLALPDGRKETEPESWDFVRSVAKDLIDACVANEAVLSGGTDVVGPSSRIEISIRGITPKEPNPLPAKPQVDPSCGLVSISNVGNGIATLARRYCKVAADCGNVAGCTCKQFKSLTPQVIFGTLGVIADSFLGACGS